jgi:hypothetical protein
MKLRKMYLVSPDTFNGTERPSQPPPTSQPRKTIASRGTKHVNNTKRNTKRNLYKEWIRFREKMREADATEKMQVDDCGLSEGVTRRCIQSGSTKPSVIGKTVF